MKVDECTHPCVPQGGLTEPPREEFILLTPPEDTSLNLNTGAQKGVSTENALTTKDIPKDSYLFSFKKSNTLSPLDQPHWYTLRATYGRERMAYDYLTAQGLEVYYPTHEVVKLIGGKRCRVTESLLPNLLFCHATERELRRYVFDNVHLPYLRFYYRHHHEGRIIKRTPLIIPPDQMYNLRTICEAEADDILVMSTPISKFATGTLVRITHGKFAGVVGRIARYKGQQRVGIVIEGSLTIATAYVPSGAVEKV